MKSLITLAAILLSLNSNAASFSLSTCRLLVAGNGTHSTAEVVNFGAPKVNPNTGAIERAAILNSLQVTLIQVGDITGINLHDSVNVIFFASEFKNSAMYATKENTVQVLCD